MDGLRLPGFAFLRCSNPLALLSSAGDAHALYSCLDFGVVGMQNRYCCAPHIRRCPHTHHLYQIYLEAKLDCRQHQPATEHQDLLLIASRTMNGSNSTTPALRRSIWAAGRWMTSWAPAASRTPSLPARC